MCINNEENQGWDERMRTDDNRDFGSAMEQGLLPEPVLPLFNYK